MDDDYSHCQGAAFEFMRAIDERDHRRGSLASSTSGLSPFKPLAPPHDSQSTSQGSESQSAFSLTKEMERSK